MTSRNFVQISSRGVAPVPQLSVPSIDVFITYRCGLRCSHCFVGDNLDTSRDMSLWTLGHLLRAARTWSTTEITLLGGEPTMHPQFAEAIELVQAEGFRLRIVTNGHTSFGKFIERAADTRPFVCFSIDGSTSEIHDKIRGRGTFRALIENIKTTQDRGFHTGAIVALCRDNAADVEGILRLCDRLSFEYVNVHYVTNRGFARPDTVLSVEDWQRTYREIEVIAPTLKTQLRAEKTFYDKPPGQLKCAVREQSNLMFLPDGRVYMCMMYIDMPNSHSFTWEGDELGLLRNVSSTSEQVLAVPLASGCPALALVNGQVSADVERRGAFVQCIYQKEHLGTAMPGIRG